MNTYKLVKDGEIVKVGTKYEISRLLHVSCRKIEDVQTKKWFGDFYVEKMENENEIKKIKENEEKKETMEYLIKHLNAYGNTVLNIKQKKNMPFYEKKLKEKNKKIRWRVAVDRSCELYDVHIPTRYIVVEIDKGNDGASC